MVTRIAGDGRLLHRLVDTATRSDSSRWESLLSHAALAHPPPYRPAPGVPVYVISTGEQPVLVTQHGLTGPMEALVSAVLSEGDPVQRQAPSPSPSPDGGPQPGSGQGQPAPQGAVPAPGSEQSPLGVAGPQL